MPSPPEEKESGQVLIELFLVLPLLISLIGGAAGILVAVHEKLNCERLAFERTRAALEGADGMMIVWQSNRERTFQPRSVSGGIEGQQQCEGVFRFRERVRLRKLGK